MAEDKRWNVAVFIYERKNRKKIMIAYVRDFHPSWEGYNEISVYAQNSSEAKKKAIKKVREMIEDPGLRCSLNYVDHTWK